ncbi:hypothetical protein Q4Q39_15985 [Flavivirga amylovorans]|uniref:T9SS C-terminal target domain-containing protein n=1 Tax=Flavivirga amylovorans TaxID=870486 RepID=A0ABT8X4U0_9FLAO|nr:hypothetical protein [Flavivirga amylovorans]MDO5988910.1 hypothetical protein [Flavivirga amylovorans]
MRLLQLIQVQVILFGILSITSSAKAQITINTNKVIGNLSSYSVSLSDDATTLAIGTHQANNNSTKSGRVRIYKKKSEGWSQIGNDINGETIGDWSGYSVSLSGNGTTVAIGAKRNHGRNGVNSGHVRVYKNELGVWKQVGEDIDGEAQGDWSGYSVGLSQDGNTVAIGAVLNSDNGIYSGHVRIYKNNSGKWIQIGADINGKAAKDYFGASVSLSGNGNMVAVGAHQGGVSSGYVSVYKNISGRWVQIGKDIVGEPTGNFSGWNISLSNNGTNVVIAAYNNDDGKRYAYVRTYQNKSSTWIQQGADIDGKTMGHNLSGLFNNINLGNNGTITLIGAYEEESGKNKQTPSISYVRMYRFKKSSNIWANTQI